ncbi:MAG: PAS domain S-box protein, partial [Euryarchaeota archaeon]|nr:PAS domain S-box protein [Euryarchaeota archaeon]
MPKAKILIVEDDAIEAMDIQRTLESMGYEVPTVASSGEDAIKKTAKINPDLILMDIILKGKINGIDAAENIKNDFDIPVVYLTAHSEESTVKRALVTEPYGYLLKPFDRTELKFTIDLALYKHDMEITLKENEERLKLAQINANIGVWDWFTQTGELSWSPELERLYGLVPGTIHSYQDWRGLVHPDDIARIEEERDEAIAKKQPFDLEFRILHKSGKIRWINAKGKALYDENGKVIRVTGINLDITERKQAEYRIKEEHQRVMDIIDFLPDATFVIDKEKKVIAWNRAIEHMTGIKSKDMIGKSDYSYALPFYGEPRPILIDLVLSPEKDIESRYDYLKREGDSLYAESFVPCLYDGRGAFLFGKASPIYDSKGNISGAIESIRDVTGRKLAEESLKKSEAKYRSLVESSEDSIYLVDKDCVYQFANKKYASRLGLPADQIIGKAYSEFQPEEEAEDFSEKVDEVSKTGKFLQYEYKSLKDSKYFLRTLSPVKNPQGKIIAITVVSKNITNLKKTEEALKISEAYYRTIFENTGTAILIDEEDTTISMINTETEKLFGYSKEEMEGKSWIEFMVKDDLEKIKKYHNLRRIDPNAAPRNYEFRLIDKQGNVRNISATVDMIPGTGNSVASLLDITERKQAEESLRESEEKYRKLVNTSVDGVISVDSQMKVILWNQASERLFGYAEKEILGKSLMKIVPKRYRKAKERGFGEFRKSGSGPVIGKTLELEGLRKDGTEIPVELSVSSRRVGETYIATAMVRDIAERKNTENALKRSERHFRSVVETAEDAIVTTDGFGDIIFWNDAAEKIFEYSSAEVLGKNVDVLIPDKSKVDHHEGMKNIESPNSVIVDSVIEGYGIRKDGTEFPIELSMSSWELDGEIFFTTIIRDVAERKKAEKQIKESLKEKEVLLSEIHHRVKNNLQIVSSLMNLQTRYVDDQESINV